MIIEHKILIKKKVSELTQILSDIHTKNYDSEAGMIVLQKQLNTLTQLINGLNTQHDTNATNNNNNLAIFLLAFCDQQPCHNL